METPAQRLEKSLKEWFEKFKKSPLALPAAIGLIAVVAFVSLSYLKEFLCFYSLITPAAMVGILWVFDYKRVKKLLVIGLVATIPAIVFTLSIGVDELQGLDRVVSTSADGTLINNGTLEPFFGNKTTVYWFNATVNLQNVTEVQDARVVIYSLHMSYVSEEKNNYTMELVSQTNLTANYTCSTTINAPINGYIYEFKIDDRWYAAGEVEYDIVYVVQGPFSDDGWAMGIALIPWGILNGLLSTYMPFAIICAMIWWVRRARRMRTEAIERLAADREKKKEELPKDKAKVPSLSSAMGLSKEEMFVCSECGADVPGDAKMCPKCGEKFE